MGKLRTNWGRSAVILSILIIVLSISHINAHDKRNFEITRLEIDVDIDLNGTSQVAERIFLKNISSNTINSIEMNIEGQEIWDLKAFKYPNHALPILITQKDISTYKIEIKVDIEARETKELWIQYLCNTATYISGFEDFQYLKVEYSFSEFEYLSNNEYPLTVRFWAPIGLVIATNTQSSVYSVRDGKYQERNYIRLLFREKPDEKIITVTLRDREDISTYHAYFSETLYLSEEIPIVKFEAEFISCTTFHLNYIVLPYRGKNHKIYPDDSFEILSDSFPPLLVPKEGVYFEVGDHIGYVLEYEVDDPTFNDPFFTAVRKEILETRNYFLELVFNEKPYFLFNPPYREQSKNVYVEESWENDHYIVRIQHSITAYFDTIRYATIFMTKDQFKTNLSIVGILLIFSSIIYIKRHLIMINKDFVAYISLIFLFILISLIYIAFFSHSSILNIFFYFLVAALTFVNFFLYLFFSRNLSFDYGILFALGFLLTHHGQHLAQIVILLDFILAKDMARELILSVLGLMPLVVLYLYIYKEKELKQILTSLYQGIKNLTSPLFFVFLILALPLCVVSTLVFFLKLTCSCVLFVSFLCLSFRNFSLVFSSSEYRRKNDYEVYTGIVTNISKQENKNVEFHFRYLSNEDKGNVQYYQEKVLVYDNQFNYPVFGLSYSEIEEGMKLMVATKRYKKRDQNLKVWIVKLV